ncbi:MAG TPA: IPT/TIG domain-containing protein, partial [Candidatus Sulfotelmatobacter sp.]|nr:IPT/TIG domain-containing protein [Candidatus Sulfotelmatobacter sp.]
MTATNWPFLAPLLCSLLLAGASLQAGPVIYSFSPASGRPGDTFVLTGKNLDQAKLLFLGGYGCVFQLDTSLNLTVTVPEAAVTGPIVIYAADSVVQSQDAFAVIPPKESPAVTAVDPLSGAPGLRVSITGTNLLGATAVSFGGGLAEFLVADNTRLVATLPPKAQSGIIEVTTPAGTAKSPASFTVTPAVPLPAIFSFKPASGSNGTEVALSGTALSGIKQVLFNGVPALFQEVNELAALAEVPPGAWTGPITIQTTNGSATSLDDFMVPAVPTVPRIETFSSWQGQPGDKIRVRGGGFAGVQKVVLGAVTAQFTVLSPAEIEVVVPKNAASGSVFISTDSGQAVSEVPFVVSALNSPPPAAPKLQSTLAQVDGQVRLQFPAEPFHPYVLEFADTLSAAGLPNWNQFSAEPPHDTPQLVSVLDASGSQSRFFRAQVNVAGFQNWDFELGLIGWTATGAAFANQPVFGEAYLKNQTESSDLVNAVGGDYWNVRVHLGHHGDSWIGTGQEHPESDSPIVEDPTVLDQRTGTLTSSDFRLTQPWVSFLIGGGFSAPHPRTEAPVVEIDASPNSTFERDLWRSVYPAADRGFFRVSVASVLDSDKEMMRRHVVGLGVFTNHIVHIRIIDNSAHGHINVDDFRFS